jgi:hypothetical protein
MKHADVAIDGEILTVKVDLTEVILGLRSQLERWQATTTRLRKQWEESEWYLGEARATIGRLEEQLAALQATCDGLQARQHELTARLEEANWFLGEARAAQAQLQADNQHLIDLRGGDRLELEETRRKVALIEDRLRAEHVFRRSIESDLAAVQTHGERRGAARAWNPQLTAELLSPDGVLLFRGAPRNVSRTGFAFATEQPLTDVPEFLEVIFRVPGLDRPLEGIGRLAWQEQGPTASTYLAGCELLDMPAESFTTFEQFCAREHGNGQGGS